MAGITGSADAGVFGLAWRDPSKKPLGVDAANNVAMVLRVYYEGLAVAGVKIDPRLLVKLEGRLTPVRGQEDRWIRSNPLSAGTSSHRPRMVPDEVIEVLLERPGVLLRTRDRMIVIWLKDSGIRVGGLCGLRFCDL
ncbi:tyrosine-type recombinase/integrase, partial [Mycobacterium kansasii]